MAKFSTEDKIQAVNRYINRKDTHPLSERRVAIYNINNKI